ncbi:MAG: ATP-binding protein, partial [bacterium]
LNREPMNPEPENLSSCMELIKMLARTMGQMGLYKPSHPAVRESIAHAHSVLEQLLSADPGGEFTLAVDNDKVIANSRVLFPAANLPGSIRNFFTRLRLHSVTFKAGVTVEELVAFCGLSGFKPEGGTKLSDALSRDGVQHISINEAIYAKVEKTPTASPAAAPGADGTIRPPTRETEPLDRQIASQPLETAVITLAAKATPQTEERETIVQLVMQKFRTELEQKVREATVQIKKEKKKVENDQARTETVISSVAEGLLVVDSSGKVLMMNPAAEQLSGKSLAEAAGKPVFDITGLEKQVIALAKEISHSGDRDISREVTVKGDADLSKTMRRATAIVQNEEGRIVGTVSVAPDVAKLKEVRKMQEDFVANVTHELRSPLTSIRTALDMLNRDLRGKLGDGDTRVMQTAIRNAERLNSLITDILDFSKLESGKLTTHPDETPAAEIAAEAMEAMRSWAGTKALQLSLSAAENLPPVFADRRRSVQVLINLISNAIKFTPNNGSIILEIGKETAASGGNFVAFSVKDTGPGISREDQKKLFEKFAQLAAGERTGGTGLGLSITKALVVMQGGHLALESEPGKGSTFKVLLPVYTGQKKDAAPEPVFEPPAPKNWWQKLFGG